MLDRPQAARRLDRLVERGLAAVRGGGVDTQLRQTDLPAPDPRARAPPPRAAIIWYKKPP
jgi:hypothetical protein